LVPVPEHIRRRLAEEEVEVEEEGVEEEEEEEEETEDADEEEGPRTPTLQPPLRRPLQ